MARKGKRSTKGKIKFFFFYKMLIYLMPAELILLGGTRDHYSTNLEPKVDDSQGNQLWFILNDDFAMVEIL